MPELNFVKILPDSVPLELNVYSTEKPVYSQSEVKKIMDDLKFQRITALAQKRAPITRTEFRYVDNWMIGNREGFTVAINRLSGAMNFRDERRHGQEAEAKFSISERRLVEIARKFSEDKNLLTQPAKDLKVAKVTYLRTKGAAIGGHEEVPEQILDAGVIFQREIDGIPVAGFGGFAMVNIAHDESVVAASKVWRNISKKVEKTKILQPDYAVNELQKRLTGKGIKDSVNILKADFCYFEANNNMRQAYLEPSYAFLYETKVGQFNYKSVEIIPATPEPKQRWVFRKQFPAPSVIR